MNIKQIAHLYASQRVPIYIIMFNEPSALAKYVHAALMSVIDLIAPNRGVTVRRYPHPGEVVGVYLVVYELSESGLVNVYAPCLAVVDLAVDDGGVRAGLHFETGDSVVVDVVSFEVALEWNVGFLIGIGRRLLISV